MPVLGAVLIVLTVVLVAWQAAWPTQMGSVWLSPAEASLMRPRLATVYAEADRLFLANTPQGKDFIRVERADQALAHMMRYRYVERAFFGDNRGHIWLEERSRADGQLKRYRYDIRTSLPVVLDPTADWPKQYWKDPHYLPRFEAWQRNTMLLDWVINHPFLDQWNAAVFYPQPPQGVHENMFYAKKVEGGQLGFQLDRLALSNDIQSYSIPRFHARTDIYFTSRPLVDLVQRPLALRYLDLNAFPTADEYTPPLRVFEGVLFLGGIGLVLCAAQILHQLRKMLQEGTVALAQSNFVSAVSHEMRTPLTTIKLYAELLDQGVVEDPTERHAFLATIGQECDRLSRLVNNVLDYASLDAKHKTYHFEPLEVRELIVEALASLKGPLERAQMRVETEMPTALKVHGDRDALVQALVNVIGNAAKYAPAGSLVRIAATLDAGCVKLSVTDQGPGIPPRERRRIFKPFYRIGNELTRTTKGSGLGLTLVQAYMKAHGGRVELDSSSDQGTTFRLVIPQAKVAA